MSYFATYYKTARCPFNFVGKRFIIRSVIIIMLNSTGDTVIGSIILYINRLQLCGNNIYVAISS